MTPEEKARLKIDKVFAVVGLIIVLVTCSMISSCSLLGGGSGDAAIATTFLVGVVLYFAGKNKTAE